MGKGSAEYSDTTGTGLRGSRPAGGHGAQSGGQFPGCPGGVERSGQADPPLRRPRRGDAGTRRRARGRRAEPVRGHVPGRAEGNALSQLRVGQDAQARRHGLSTSQALACSPSMSSPVPAVAPAHSGRLVFQKMILVLGSGITKPGLAPQDRAWGRADLGAKGRPVRVDQAGRLSGTRTQRPRRHSQGRPPSLARHSPATRRCFRQSVHTSLSSLDAMLSGTDRAMSNVTSQPGSSPQATQIAPVWHTCAKTFRTAGLASPARYETSSLPSSSSLENHVRAQYGVARHPAPLKDPRPSPVKSARIQASRLALAWKFSGSSDHVSPASTDSQPQHPIDGHASVDRVLLLRCVPGGFEDSLNVLSGV
jgi:hypothetical protein